VAPIAFALLPALTALMFGTPQSAETQEVWAGHAVVIGHRNVPFLGKVEARTESYVLAKVTKRGDTITLDQVSCAVDLQNPTGVKLSLNPDAPERLPPVRLEFEKKSDGLWYQHEATSGWDKEDVDADGHPGMTVNVDAPICGGKLFVGAHTTSLARGSPTPEGGLKGQMKLKVRQTVIDTEGACLSILVKDSEEKAAGYFAYAPVPKDATCESLKKGGWPVTAAPPSKH
jgi:hypothetical protein